MPADTREFGDVGDDLRANEGERARITRIDANRARTTRMVVVVRGESAHLFSPPRVGEFLDKLVNVDVSTVVIGVVGVATTISVRT